MVTENLITKTKIIVILLTVELVTARRKTWFKVLVKFPKWRKIENKSIAKLSTIVSEMLGAGMQFLKNNGVRLNSDLS